MERTPHRMPLTKTQIDRRQRSRRRNRQRRRGLRQRQRRQMDWFDNMLQSQEHMGMGPHIFEQPGQLLAINPELDDQYTRCVICLEGHNFEGMGELLYPCNCENELGRYHYHCLCDNLEATIDRRCLQCRKQFNDPRIERYDVTTDRGIQRMIRFRDYGGPGADRIVNLTEALQAHSGADNVRAWTAFYLNRDGEVDENKLWDKFAQSLDLAFAKPCTGNTFMWDLPEDRIEFMNQIRQRGNFLPSGFAQQQHWILQERFAQERQRRLQERLAQEQRLESLFNETSRLMERHQQANIDNEQLRIDNEQLISQMRQRYGTPEDRVPQQETPLQQLLREFHYDSQFPSTGQSSLTRQSPLPPGETYGNFNFNIRTVRPMSELLHEDSDDEQQREVHENRFFQGSGGPPPDPSVFGESSKSQDISAGREAMLALLEAERQRHQQILDQFQEFQMGSNTRLPQSQQTAQPPLLQQPFGQQPQQPPQYETSSSDEELD